MEYTFPQSRSCGPSGSPKIGKKALDWVSNDTKWELCIYICVIISSLHIVVGISDVCKEAKVDFLLSQSQPAMRNLTNWHFYCGHPQARRSLIQNITIWWQPGYRCGFCWKDSHRVVFNSHRGHRVMLNVVLVLKKQKCSFSKVSTIVVWSQTK